MIQLRLQLAPKILDFKFMCSFNEINNQLDATIKVYLWFQSAQHVSGVNFARLQEHWSVFTACGIMHRRCCLLVSAGSFVGALYHNL